MEKNHLGQFKESIEKRKFTNWGAIKSFSEHNSVSSMHLRDQ